ncbi:MarR family winged helix-turn-helix transcriptional regulator [Burkholderia gladioli]|uniref:MarR family winged helix-turn-helix transcriptional regulator n=2 Tax=Burkholderia gladioli TaxID=28095 RepID=UPI001FC8AE35|nr:MarR family transcriptional regulator [Burkholderia gladioli]
MHHLPGRRFVFSLARREIRVYARIMNTPCICTDLRQAARQLTSIYDAALASHGINIAQYFLLRTIADHQPVSLTDLGTMVDLDRSTIGRNVKVLERLGLAATGSGKDQRETVVVLNEEGAVLLRAATPKWESCQARLVARLGKQKTAALRSALSELTTLSI